MENQRKTPGKRAYLKDFQMQEDGSYGYGGAHWNCSLKPEDYRRELGFLLALAFLALALSFAAGCFTDTGMEGCFYLLLPYAAGIVMMILLTWALIRMFSAGPRLRDYVYRKTAVTISWKSVCGIVLSGAALLGLLYALFSGTYTGKGPGGLLFVVSQAAELAASTVIYLRNRKLHWAEEV